MSSLTLGVRIPGSGLRRHRLPAVDFNLKLNLLKEEAAKETGLSAETLEFVHHGRILEDDKCLHDYGVKPGEVLYVLQKTPPVKPEPSKRITEIEVQEYVSFFRSFKHPAESALTLLLQIRDYGHSDSFLSSMSSLANDPVAVNYLREPELLQYMGDPDTIRRVAEKHPSFIEAVKKISEMKETKQITSRRNFGRNTFFHSPDSDDDDDVDVIGENDDEDGSGGEGTSGGNIITPEQLSTALALAGMAAGGSSSSSRSSNSSSDNLLPGFREFLGAFLGSDRPSSSSSPGPSSRPIITPDMFSNALTQAMTNASTTSSTPESSTSTSDATAAEEAANARLYAEQLSKMQEMGLTDNRINLRALIINNGDVNAAINLVLSYLS